MDFKLNFTFPVLPKPIQHTDSVLLLGSCFAENIGELLHSHKFSVVQNPNGIVFNPLSIVQHIESYIENKQITSADLFQYLGLWNSWQHHSRFSNVDANKAVETINDHTKVAHEQLKKAKWLFITWGSAYVYQLKETQQLVANCHKVPQKEFAKKLVSSSEITAAYQKLIKQLKSINPNLHILFTVSPVRYVRDGIIENNRSKAELLSAVHSLVTEHNHVHYFPSYEIVIDELRDYRFFKEDLVHPNDLAIKYVWQRFKDFAFNEATIKLIADISDIVNASKHKLHNTTIESTQQFKEQYHKKCTDLLAAHPHINLDKELTYFTHHITA